METRYTVYGSLSACVSGMHNRTIGQRPTIIMACVIMNTPPPPPPLPPLHFFPPNGCGTYTYRMRPFGAPKSFEMRRNRAEAAGALRRFVGDAWDVSGGDVEALWASSRHPKEAVDTELLPAARCVFLFVCCVATRSLVVW